MDQQHTDLQQQRLATWFESTYDYTRPRPAQVLEAVILSISENEVIVHLAETKRDGIVPAKDLHYLDDAYRATLKVGDLVPG